MGQARDAAQSMVRFDTTRRTVVFHDPNHANTLPVGNADTPSYYSLNDGPHSSTADGVKQMLTFTYQEGYSTRYWTVAMTGYISSGTYYYSWGLYNTTQSVYVPLAGQNNSYLTGTAWQRTINGESYDCRAKWAQRSVHSYAAQTAVTFDMSNEAQGNTIALVMTASNNTGTTTNTNASQTLYCKEVMIWAGFAPYGVNIDGYTGY